MFYPRPTRDELAKWAVKGVAIDDPWGSGPPVMNGHCGPQPMSAVKCPPQLEDLGSRRPAQLPAFFARNGERNRVWFKIGPIGADFIQEVGRIPAWGP